MPSARADGDDKKTPLMFPSIFNLVEGRGASGGEKIRMSEAVGRIKCDSSAVIRGSLYDCQLLRTECDQVRANQSSDVF